MKIEIDVKPRQIVPELSYTPDMPTSDDDMVQKVDDTFEMVNTALRYLTKLSLQTRHEQDRNAQILHKQVDTVMRDLKDYFDEYQERDDV